MIYFGKMSDITNDFDEIWAIVRSMQIKPQTKTSNVIQVSALAPSKELFHKYLNWRADGEWNEETFKNKYTPLFLQEMNTEYAQNYLNNLYKKGQQKDILIVCYCVNEKMCHKGIIKELLEDKCKKDGIENICYDVKKKSR